MQSQTDLQNLEHVREYIAAHQEYILSCVNDVVIEWAQKKITDFKAGQVQNIISAFEQEGQQVMTFLSDLFESEVNAMVFRKFTLHSDLSPRGIQARVFSNARMSMCVFATRNADDLRLKGVTAYDVHLSVVYPLSSITVEGSNISSN